MQWPSGPNLGVLLASHAIDRVPYRGGHSPFHRLRVASAVTLVLATSFVLPQPAGASNLPQAWVQAASLPTGFTPRWDAAYAAFPPKQQVVLFGGAPAGVGDPWWNDTWVYTTTTGIWSQGPAAPPGLTPRGGSSMAYDPAIGKIVLFGGAVENSATPSNRTWLFDGTSWSKGPAAPQAMSGRVGARMAYLPNQRKLVLFGGSGTTPENDTWFFDGTAWTPGPAAPAGLDPRVYFGMTYDESVGKIVVAGGDGTRTVWYFGGAKWTQGPDLPTAVGGRDRVSLAYDPQLGGTVLFGGLGPAPANRSVYILRGGAWTYLEMPSLHAPSGRLDPALLWDDATKSLVVVGGIKNSDNGKTGFSETWKLVSPPVEASPASGAPGTKVAIDSGPGWLPGDQISIKQGKKSLGTADVSTGGTIHEIVTVQAGSGQVMLLLTSSELSLSVGVQFTISNKSSGDAASSTARSEPPGSAGEPPAESREAQAPTSNTPKPANGQIQAHDHRFWLGSTPVLLRGVDAAPIQNVDMKDSDYATIESWNMNFIRMRVFWHMMEPNPPHKVGGAWVHAWNEGAMTNLKKQVGFAYEHGQYSLIENYCGPPCFSKGWPDWLYQAPYNSHGKDYTDAVTANTDYWTDPLQQKFTKDFVTYLATSLKGVPGIMGYEPLNEPNKGTYPDAASTTTMILDAQYPMAQAVRTADPTRVVVFTTRGSSGEGILAADLSKFSALTNVAFDLHDYFGARWGDGLNMDPASATYGESLQSLFDFTLTPGTPPYLGTTLGQLRFIRTFTNVLDPLGIPLVVGEFGGQGEAEPNINPLYSTMTQAFDIEGVSWAAQSYNGSSSFFRDDGSLEPWVPILSAAAAQSG